jgi:hypothetical protein
MAPDAISGRETQIIDATKIRRAAIVESNPVIYSNYSLIIRP